MITERDAAARADEISRHASLLALLICFFSFLIYVLNFVAYYAGFYGYIPSVVIGAICSFYLFAIMHDASHGSLVPKSKFINDIVGVVVAFVLNTHFDSFRKTHKKHHIYANSNNDPDLIYRKQGKYVYIFTVPVLLVLLKIFSTLPKFIKNKLFRKVKGKTKIFIYFYNKDKSQVNLYRFTLSLAIISTVLYGFNSVITLAYVISMAGMFLIYFQVNWLPHSTIFDRREESTNRYKTAKIHSFPFSNILMWGTEKHLVHHLYPQVQVTRLKAMYRYSKELIGKELEDQ
jgi:fatty acid desaturase